MKKLLLLISFIIFHVYSYTQTDVQRDNRVSPVLKSALNQKNGYIIYGRDNSSRFINIAVLNQSSRTMSWFTCHGRLFDSTRLTDLEYGQVTSKKLDPFTLYQHICNEYLIDIGVAKDIFRLNGDNKLVDSLNPNYHVLFASESVQKAKTSLQKLIVIENIRKHILTQVAYVNCANPFGLQDNPLFKYNKEQAGALIQTKDSTVYYNIDPASAITKISLYKNSPEKLYIFNRLSQLIDSVSVLPEKYDLLLKEKTDVFLLYRGWLELQWQGAMDNIMRYIKGIDTNDTALYRNANIKDEKSIAKELYGQLHAIEAKINVLISPEAKSIEQAIYDTYKNATSEISYIPLLGIGYDLVQTRGLKEYELTNHLGNVLATVSDKKLGHSSNDSTVDYYNADVVSAQDYYPFGMLQPGRAFNVGKYRYGFNGKENDNEVKGEGNQQDYGMRIYDPRLGRFLSVDPLTSEFPWYTPYQFAGNKPIMAVDLDGLEDQQAITVTEEKKGTVLRVAWKEGNGKVVQMVRGEGMSTKIFNIVRSLGWLNLIRQVFSSPSTSPQDVAKESYPRLGGTPLEDKFWERWIGPGRNFPLPPTNSEERAQWLADYWPEGLPINLPNPVNVPQVETKPIDDEGDKDDGYITLYRGVGDDVNPKTIYDLAKKGIAYPRGLLPGHSPVFDADDHTAGLTESIYTSWTTSAKQAEYFARGPMGTAGGVILSKRFKKSQLVRSSYADLMQEGEYLVPGVVTGASTDDVPKINLKR